MTQYTLKCIAMVVMLLDHFSAVVLRAGVLRPWLGMTLDWQLQVWLEAVGRIAFPIFAWCTAVGCEKSKHPGKYLLRMAMFALLSEVPFQLAFHKALAFRCQNVIFTLLLAALAVYAGGLRVPHIPQWYVRLLTATGAVLGGWFLKTDYNGWGVALVLGLYYIRERKGKLLYLSAWITVFQLIWHGWNGQTLVWLTGQGSLTVLYWLCCMVSVGLIAGCGGERGKGSKWLFYVFYPAHLLALYGITLL